MRCPLRISTETALLIEVFLSLLSLSRQIFRRYLKLGYCDLHRHPSHIFIPYYPTLDAVGPYFTWKCYVTSLRYSTRLVGCRMSGLQKQPTESGNCQLSDKIVTVYIVFVTANVVKLTASKYWKRLARFVAGHSFIPHMIHPYYEYVRLFRLLFCFQKLWGPPCLLHSGYRVFPGGKAAGAWSWPHTPI